MMTDMKKALRFGLVLALCPVSAFAQIHTKQVLTGYKCMMLAKQWAGEGPTPPPVPVYDGPSAGAKQIGIAGGTVIVPTLAQSIDGRVSMVRINGEKAWIDATQIVPWASKADPSATCRPVILANGRYGTDGGR
jgi:hypothetical protein